MDMMVEFNDYNYSLEKKNHKEVRKVNAIISLGTGQINSKPFTLPELGKFFSWNVANNISYVKEMFSIIIDSACNTDYHIVDR